MIQTQLPDEEERLVYKECKKYFGDLCMVMVPRDVARPVTCTCELFSKCAECPHTLAVLELLKRNSPPLLGSPLPLGVGGRAGRAPKRKQPTSAHETQEQVNAQADARIAERTRTEQPLSAAFFREIVAKKAGTLLFKDIPLKVPLPLGAQTLAQTYQGWARSMKRLKKTKEIAVTKGDPNNLSTWKVDVLA